MFFWLRMKTLIVHFSKGTEHIVRRQKTIFYVSPCAVMKIDSQTVQLCNVQLVTSAPIMMEPIVCVHINKD